MPGHLHRDLRSPTQKFEDFVRLDVTCCSWIFFWFSFSFLTLRVRTKVHLEGVQSGSLEVSSASSGIPSETSMVSEMPLLGVVHEEDPEPLQTIYLWLYLDVGPAIGKDVAASQVPSVAADVLRI